MNLETTMLAKAKSGHKLTKAEVAPRFTGAFAGQTRKGTATADAGTGRNFQGINSQSICHSNGPYVRCNENSTLVINGESIAIADTERDLKSVRGQNVHPR